MDTRIVALSSEKLEDFKAYCRKHRQEVDDSFLYDEDLAEFQIHGEHPTYIALNGEGELIGAASIIADAYQRKGMQARFRILHCESGDPAVYRRLLDEIVKHGEGLGGMFIFVPSVNPGLMEIIGQLGFQVERYSFLLVNEPLQPASYELPEGYDIRAFPTRGGRGSLVRRAECRLCPVERQPDADHPGHGGEVCRGGRLSERRHVVPGSWGSSGRYRQVHG
ncbi:hypothetical protein HMSSN139_37480 [Paenibacillus sp. HMSSN-139]|nr:hypothetical protein HMSSN139_37480 [Paenibacillus sp. HMSSN-139]